MPFKLEDLSPRHRAEAEAQLAKVPYQGTESIESFSKALRGMSKKAQLAPPAPKGAPKEAIRKRGGGPDTPKASKARKSQRVEGGRWVASITGSNNAQTIIRLVLPYPPSANSMWRNVLIGGHPRTLLSREGRKFKKAVADILTAGNISPIVGPVGYRAYVYRPRRIGDLGNRLKALEDALQGFCYSDDDQIVSIEAHRADDKDFPHVEVVLRAISPATH